MIVTVALSDDLLFMAEAYPDSQGKPADIYDEMLESFQFQITEQAVDDPPIVDTSGGSNDVPPGEQQDSGVGDAIYEEEEVVE